MRTPINPEHEAPPHATARRARELLRSRSLRAPDVTTLAPGRVNLIGEHTDYSGGFVLPIAIDRVASAAVVVSPDPTRSRIWTDQAQGDATFDLRRPISPGSTLPDGSPIAPGDWRSYAVGVLSILADHARSLGADYANLDLAIASDVPIGGGLSSSASFELSIASAAAEIWRLEIPPLTLASLCRTAEHRFAGVPCGLMDQAISAMGRSGHALLLDCRSERAEHVPMPGEEQAAVLVINSNVRHSLSSSRYSQRREACRRAALLLGVPELRDATTASITNSAPLNRDPEALAAAMHVTTENARTLSAAAALRAGDLAELGRLMIESHRSLRDVYRVSCPELDTIVDAAASTPGVFGARMTGGGFGGCAVVVLQPEAICVVRERVVLAARDMNFPGPASFRVRASDGVRTLQSPCNG